MERLTEWNGRQPRDAYYPRCFEEPCYGGGCKINDCPFETAVCERLAAYEDTGLMPEEVLPKDKADEIALKLMRLADLESLCSYDHLRELAEADKEGRLVVLERENRIVYGNVIENEKPIEFYFEKMEARKDG